MECPNCHFVVTPGEAAVQGTCPNCERPYMDQPSPLNSDMALRDMPAAGGGDDMGGNPLKEGILGDWQQGMKRDESYASVKKSNGLPDGGFMPNSPEGEEWQKQQDQQFICPQCGNSDMSFDLNFQTGLKRDWCRQCGYDQSFPYTNGPLDPLRTQFELESVIPPDPDSLRSSKDQMDKQADFWDDAADFGADVALPVAGGTAGFLVGGPAGAAAGAALGAGAGNLAQGDELGEAALGAAPYAVGGGLGGIGAKMMAGGAAQAVAAGSTRGGIGSLMRSAWGKVPTDKIKNAYLMHSMLGDAGQAAAPITQPGVQMPAAAPAPVGPSSMYSATTPSSQDHIPSNDTSNPEKVDFHERNDGDDKGLAGAQGVNDIGGTDTGPDGLFSTDSPALQSLAELLPKVLEYALEDKPGAGDPDILSLHQALEAEHPGYMNDADDDHGTRLIVSLIGGGDKGGDDLLADNNEPHDPIAEHQATALRPGFDTACSLCGGVIDPSTGNCPQCGKGNDLHNPQPTNPDFKTPQQMMVAKTAADSQGPHTDEQKALVAQFLSENGRADEVPAMILEPYKYADELAEITGQEDPPEDVGDKAPPPPVDPSQQQGAMPVPPMGPPGGPGAAPMMASINKYAAALVDGVAEPCPKCDSHSTGYLDPEDGEIGCKTCHHTWKAKPLVKTGEVTALKVAEDHGDPNPIAVPLAEAERPEDPEQERDSSHTWTDEGGTPLKVGQSYEMYSQNYDIPDRIRIDAVKPEVIEYTITGEYGLNHSTELTHEEASIENVTFKPSQGDGDIQPNPDEGQNMEDIARPAPGMNETDLSTPHMQMASVRQANPKTINLEPNWDGMKAWILNVARTDLVQAIKVNNEMGSYRVDPVDLAQAARVSPEEVNSLMGETSGITNIPETPHPLGPQTGSSHTADFDDINGPNGPNVDPYPERICSICGAPASAPPGGCPDPIHYESAPLDDRYYELEEQARRGGGSYRRAASESIEEETGPEWLKESSDEDFYAGMDLSKTAGQKFTPFQQRDFIEENGTARNSDKLSLQGTHYEAAEIEDQFIFGL